MPTSWLGEPRDGARCTGGGALLGSNRKEQGDCHGDFSKHDCTDTESSAGSPHVPQLVREDWRSAQAPPQIACPLEHVGESVVASPASFAAPSVADDNFVSLGASLAVFRVPSTESPLRRTTARDRHFQLSSLQNR